MAAKHSEQSIALAREELDVGTREVEKDRVRIRKVVREHEEEVEIPLRHDELAVRRVPVDRVLDAPVQARQEGDVLIVPVIEERVVLQKRLVLVEELHVSRRRVEHAHKQRVVLRSEEAVVERESASIVKPQHERK